MSYNNAHYGPGIRGLGDFILPTDIYAMANSERNPNWLSFQSYLDWSSPNQSGVASNSPNPVGITNASGTASPRPMSFTQIVSQNSGVITLLAVGLLALAVLKK